MLILVEFSTVIKHLEEVLSVLMSCDILAGGFALLAGLPARADSLFLILYEILALNNTFAILLPAPLFDLLI